MRTATIYPSTTGLNILTKLDLYLTMLILHGIVIGPEDITAMQQWQLSLPYYLGYNSAGEYSTALQAHRNSVPDHILKMNDFVCNGLGKLPPERIDSSTYYQSVEEQWLILKQLDLEETKWQRLLLCFNRFYGVVKSVTRN